MICTQDIPPFPQEPLSYDETDYSCVNIVPKTSLFAYFSSPHDVYSSAWSEEDEENAAPFNACNICQNVCNDDLSNEEVYESHCARAVDVHHDVHDFSNIQEDSLVLGKEKDDKSSVNVKQEKASVPCVAASQSASSVLTELNDLESKRLKESHEMVGTLFTLSSLKNTQKANEDKLGKKIVSVCSRALETVNEKDTSRPESDRHALCDIEMISPVLSFDSTANDTRSISNSSTTSSTMRFLRHLKIKRSSIAPKSEESGGADTVNDHIEASESSEHVHLMSLLPDDTLIKYNEICYGSSSSHLASPIHSPDSIETSPSNEICTSPESKEGSLNVSPVANKSLCKEVSMYNAKELDTTALLTWASETPDLLNVSDNSVETNLSNRYRSFLSDVTRTLFLEEENSFDEKTPFEELFDDDEAFECMLQNNEFGLFGVTVKEIKIEDNAEISNQQPLDKTINLKVRPKETDKKDEVISPTVEEKSEHKVSSISNIFHLDLSSFSATLGCACSSPVAVENMTIEEPANLYYRENDRNSSSLVEIEQPLLEREEPVAKPNQNSL